MTNDAAGKSGSELTTESSAKTEASVKGGWRRRWTWVLWFLVVTDIGLVAAAFAMPDFEESTRLKDWLAFGAFFPRTFVFHAGLALLAAAAAAVLVLRTKRLAWVAVVGGVVMTLAGLGVFMPAPARPDAAKLKDAPVITVLSANLLHQNRSFDELIDFIVHHDPDIILFQEYGDNADRVLPDRFGVEYPHMVRAKRDDAFGAGVFSRIPFAEPPKPFAAAKSIGGQVVPQVRCVIEVAGEKVVVQNMHPPPPVSVSLLTEQRRLLRWLEGTIEPDAPMIAAGDFNSTPQSVSNARLRKAGWIESQAQVRGLSRGATWPALSVLRFAPGVRIDQLFHSPRLVCEMTEVGPAFGSDHLPIVARYRVLQREDGAGSGKAEDR